MSVHGALLAILAWIVATWWTWRLTSPNGERPWAGILIGGLVAALVVTWQLGI